MRDEILEKYRGIKAEMNKDTPTPEEFVRYIVDSAEEKGAYQVCQCQAYLPVNFSQNTNKTRLKSFLVFKAKSNYRGYNQKSSSPNLFYSFFH